MTYTHNDTHRYAYIDAHKNTINTCKNKHNENLQKYREKHNHTHNDTHNDIHTQ